MRQLQNMRDIVYNYADGKISQSLQWVRKSIAHTINSTPNLFKCEQRCWCWLVVITDGQTVNIRKKCHVWVKTCEIQNTPLIKRFWNVSLTQHLSSIHFQGESQWENMISRCWGIQQLFHKIHSRKYFNDGNVNSTWDLVTRHLYTNNKTLVLGKIYEGPHIN